MATRIKKSPRLAFPIGWLEVLLVVGTLAFLVFLVVWLPVLLR